MLKECVQCTFDYESNYRTLKDFEENYVGVGADNYGWYQASFESKANDLYEDIYNAGGKNVMIELWDVLKKYQGEMTNEEFIGILKKEVHPSVTDVYVSWNR